MRPKARLPATASSPSTTCRTAASAVACSSSSQIDAISDDSTHTISNLSTNTTTDNAKTDDSTSDNTSANDACSNHQGTDQLLAKLSTGGAWTATTCIHHHEVSLASTGCAVPWKPVH